jgi:hypothetical protein
MCHKDWAMFSNFISYITLNSGRNGKEILCVQLNNQRTCTYDNHNYIMGVVIFNLVIVDESL